LRRISEELETEMLFSVAYLLLIKGESF
jgi:hypothetical protein